MNQTKAPASSKTTANLAAGLTIQGATGGATYDIRLIQVDSNGNPLGGSCALENAVGSVTVDALGNGTVDVAARVLPNAANWWVDLNNHSNFSEFIDTDLVPIAS